MHCINNMNRIASGLIIASCVFYSCTSRTGGISPVHEQQQTDSLSQDEEMVLKVGDTVLYGKYAGTELDVEGTKYLIMRQSDVLAVLG